MDASGWVCKQKARLTTSKNEQKSIAILKSKCLFLLNNFRKKISSNKHSSMRYLHFKKNITQLHDIATGSLNLARSLGHLQKQPPRTSNSRTMSAQMFSMGLRLEEWAGQGNTSNGGCSANQLWMMRAVRIGLLSGINGTEASWRYFSLLKRPFIMMNGPGAAAE